MIGVPQKTMNGHGANCSGINYSDNARARSSDDGSPTPNRPSALIFRTMTQQRILSNLSWLSWMVLDQLNTRTSSLAGEYAQNDRLGGRAEKHQSRTL